MNRLLERAYNKLKVVEISLYMIALPKSALVLHNFNACYERAYNKLCMLNDAFHWNLINAAICSLPGNNMIFHQAIILL